jgi:hypothetical protein
VTGGTSSTTDAAVAGGSDLATNLTAAGSLTLANLKSLYWFGDNVIVGSGSSAIEYHPTGGTGTASGGHSFGSGLAGSNTAAQAVIDGHVDAVGGVNIPIVNIDLYVPQSGSGTRNFFLGIMSTNADVNGALPSWGGVFDKGRSFTSGAFGAPGSGTQLQEHDGTAVATDPNGIFPFSVSAYISEGKSATLGTQNLIHGSALVSLGGVSPTTGLGQSKISNPAYPITREVYNVVPTYKLPASMYTSGSDALHEAGAPDSKLDALLAGGTSTLCGLPAVIKSYGFDVLDSSDPNGFTCGETDIRAYKDYSLTSF